ncbi:MAG: hypothetical protein COA96_04425 [SAR86 cluster bacterium]|uniref:Right handed beta helix domain-containing protein n=1 Tax=SAR86 cluster bacterium TaxID=2030880 RepID=A0A2A5B5R1_9GAMM|nr:MAG: hypothetical protein COA96_04425 [SAR86 cluster bacterium]
MKFNKTKLNAIASGVALSIAVLGAEAAEQPLLTTTGAQPSAVFTGGATVNGGASFLAEVPATVATDLVATISPASTDVGKQGSLVVIVNVPGLGFYNKISGGIWVPWTEADPVQALVTKTLAAKEEIIIIDDLVGADAALAGMEIQAYVGYYTGGSLNTLTYSATPVSFSIAQVPDDGCPANTASTSGEFKGKPVCVISGRLESDTHLTSNNSYILDGAVFVGTSEVIGTKTKLTIDAGTFVFGQQGLNYLVVDRNGQLYANGSAEQPVIFTYEGDDTATADTRGQWGGIIINGSAPINEAGGEAEGEGSTGIYGGNDADDNSGSLTYVQVKYAGQNITETNELNGIAFQAVGSGTNIDFIQVHNNSDDGVEFFGGTVNAKHIVLTGNEDDGLDWTLGWNGNVQFVAVRQGSSSEHCIEADNNDDNNDATPRSNPTISNMTCAGGFDDDGEGIRLREGTSATLTNIVVSNFPVYCIDIDQTATFTNAGGSISGLNGNLVMRNSRVSTGCPFDDEGTDPFNVSDWFNAQTSSAVGGVDLGGDMGWINGTSLNAVTPFIPSDPFFDQVDYIGAIKDESSDWTAGWIYTDL